MDSLLVAGMCFTAFYPHEDDATALGIIMELDVKDLFGDDPAVSVEIASHNGSVLYICVLKRAEHVGVRRVVLALQNCSTSDAGPIITVTCEPNLAYELVEEGMVRCYARA